MRMTPIVCRFTPDTCVWTANFRIAPTAIRKMEVPMVMESPFFGGGVPSPDGYSRRCGELNAHGHLRPGRAPSRRAPDGLRPPERRADWSRRGSRERERVAGRGAAGGPQWHRAG